MKHVLKHVLFDKTTNEVYMVVCPKCKRENEVSYIPHGICAWCDFDARDMIDKDGNLIN